MNLFYTDPVNVSGSRLTLTGQEALHAGTVLRYRRGDSICVTDGNGQRFYCKVHAVDRRELVAEIDRTETVDMEKPEISVAIGIVKKRDRLEFAVEKAVELGACRIVLYRGDQSEKTGVKMDRIQATALSAMKQSLRCRLPETVLCDSLDEALSRRSDGILLVADETLAADSMTTSHAAPATDDIHDITDKASPALSASQGTKETGREENDTLSALTGSDRIFAVAGPEGGFSTRERALLEKEGAVQVSLGPYRLRTETAVVVLISRLTY